jgi:hypothetical protein
MQQERWSQLLTWSVAAAAGLLLALPALPVFSDEGGVAGGTKFYDSERLVDTLMRDEEGELARAREDVARAEAELQEAIDAGLPQDEIDERKELLELAEAELEETELYFDEELALVREQVAELSAAQLFALNRSLNNTLSNSLVPDLDSDELQLVLEGSYEKRQINALTKAFEEEAKFLAKAAEAERLFDETGDPALFTEYEHFVAKAETQKEKFLSKVDGVAAREAARAEKQSGARDAARRAARTAARDVAKQAAKAASRNAARNVARAEARRAVKNLARAEVKAERRKVTKDAARGKSGK